MYFRCRVFQLDQYDHLHVNCCTFFHIYIHSVTVANVELCVFYQKKIFFFLLKVAVFILFVIVVTLLLIIGYSIDNAFKTFCWKIR